MAKKAVIAFKEIAQLQPVAPGRANPGLRHVQEFLQRFGYFTPGSHPTGTLDEQTFEALAKFQTFHGLEPTGEFDEGTRDKMTTPRCAMADMSSGLAFTTVCKWRKTTITFACDVGSTDVPGTSAFDAIRSAFATWTKAAPLTFTEVGTDANPDVRVGWRPANDPDHSMVGGVLAHADFPPGCSVVTNSLPKPLHFDNAEHTWTIGATPGAFDIETVALHELGHILGLAHSSVPGAVMAPFVADNFTLRVLTPDDISGIQNLYAAVAPVPPAPPWPGRLLRFPPPTKGADVLAWQQRMAERGFAIAVDGIYGSQSKAACISFQKQQGIQADGIVGRITWERTFAPL